MSNLPLAENVAIILYWLLICKPTIASSALQSICAMTGQHGAFSQFCLTSLNLSYVVFSLPVRSIIRECLPAICVTRRTLQQHGLNQQLLCYSTGPCRSYIGTTGTVARCDSSPSPQIQYLNVIHMVVSHIHSVFTAIQQATPSALHSHNCTRSQTYVQKWTDVVMFAASGIPMLYNQF